MAELNPPAARLGAYGNRHNDMHLNLVRDDATTRPCISPHGRYLP